MTVKGWDQSLMMALLTKEATYGSTATTVSSSNFVGVKGHSDYDPDWADDVQTNKDAVSGLEGGTELEVVSQGFKFNVSQARAKPYFVIGMMAGALGTISASQDPGKTAYRQDITRVAHGTSLPSFNVIGKKGGLQYLHKGCMVNTVELSGEAGKTTSCSAEIMGSGHRETEASSFIAEPTQSWLLQKNGYAWIETSAAKSIDATKTQGSENISSGSPRDLKAIIKKFTYKHDNKLAGNFGFGAGNSGVFQSLDYGQRDDTLTLDLLHVDGTDLAYYTAGTILTLEIEVKGALIAAGGTMYYGYNLIVPRFMLKKAPLPKGALGDALTNTYECDIQEDGTNPPVIFNGYSEIAAFFA